MIFTWEIIQVPTLLFRGFLVGVGVSVVEDDVVGCELRAQSVWEGEPGSVFG